MELNRTWIEKVSFLRQLLSAAPMSPGVAQLVVGISQRMTFCVHAQSEVFGEAQVLYILNLGLVSCNFKLHMCGSVWGADFVLSDEKLLEPFEALALTYVEVTILR